MCSHCARAAQTSEQSQLADLPSLERPGSPRRSPPRPFPKRGSWQKYKRAAWTDCGLWVASARQNGHATPREKGPGQTKAKQVSGPGQDSSLAAPQLVRTPLERNTGSELPAQWDPCCHDKVLFQAQRSHNVAAARIRPISRQDSAPSMSFKVVGNTPWRSRLFVVRGFFFFVFKTPSCASFPGHSCLFAVFYSFGQPAALIHSITLRVTPINLISTALSRHNHE